MTAKTTETAREFLAGYPLAYENNLYPHLKHIRGFTRLRQLCRKVTLETIGTRTNQGNYKIETLDNKPVFSNKKDARYYVVENKFFREIYNELLEADVFCDVGGYHGFYSVVSPAEKNYCFEVDPDNLDHIKENAELNSDKHLEIVNKAVWSSNGSVNIDTGHGGESCVSSKGLEVESVTLDSFFENRRDPDVVKVDVEGAEGHVLDGAEKLLERSHPTLFIEFHFDNRLSSFGHEYTKLIEMLENLGYSLSVLLDRGSEELVVAK